MALFCAECGALISLPDSLRDNCPECCVELRIVEAPLAPSDDADDADADADADDN